MAAGLRSRRRVEDNRRGLRAASVSGAGPQREGFESFYERCYVGDEDFCLCFNDRVVDSFKPLEVNSKKFLPKNHSVICDPVITP